MIKTTIAALSLSTLAVFSAVDSFYSNLPHPAEIRTEINQGELAVSKALFYLGRDPKFVRPILKSAGVLDIDPIFWTFLIDSESGFKITARSPKGYVGLGQTPKAVGKTGYEVADLVYAASIYNEKLKIAKGDTFLATALYKGGNNKMAKKQAADVFRRLSAYKAKLREETKNS